MEKREPIDNVLGNALSFERSPLCVAKDDFSRSPICGMFQQFRKGMNEIPKLKRMSARDLKESLSEMVGGKVTESRSFIRDGAHHMVIRINIVFQILFIDHFHFKIGKRNESSDIFNGGAWYKTTEAHFDICPELFPKCFDSIMETH